MTDDVTVEERPDGWWYRHHGDCGAEAGGYPTEAVCRLYAGQHASLPHRRAS